MPVEFKKRKNTQSQTLKNMHITCATYHSAEAYPGGQIQPLAQGGEGTQEKFMARFAQEIPQFTPAAGNPGAGDLQS